jgi:hypothetical protein
MNRLKKIQEKSKGSITIELLIAFFILTTAVSVAVIVLWQNQSLVSDTQTAGEALYRAQTILEAARASARNDFSAVASQSPVVETNGSISYTKTLDVTSLDSYTKQATSTVTWSIGGRSFTITLSTLLTNFTSLLGVDRCSQTLTGDWKNPRHWDYPLTSIVGGNVSNGLGISDVQENRGKLYVTAYSPMNNGYTLLVFALPTDPSQSPTFAGGVDNNLSSSDGLNAVAISKNGTKNYAYVASARQANYGTCTQGTNCSQLQIVDVTNPATSGWNPTIVNFKVPGVTGSGGQGIGNTIFYDNGYVYLGLVTGGGSEFQIINVSDPLNPIPAGSYPVGRTVEGIFVKGNYAYVMTDDNSGTNKQLLVLDVSNKNTTPLPLQSYYKVTGAGFGRSVSVNGSQIYISRTYTNGSPTIYLLDGSNLSASPLGSLGSISGTANVLAVTGRSNYLFDLTDSQFQVWDVSSPASPAPYSPDGTTASFISLSAVGGSGTTFNCAGNYFYTAVKSSQGNNKDILTIITPGAIAPSSISLEVRDTTDTSITTAIAGQVIHAAASVSGSLGTPTGNVTFTYYTNQSCNGAGTGAGTVALSSGVANPSTSEGPLTVGSGYVAFKAHYAGDYQYSTIDSSCVPITVTKANQTITATTHAPPSATYTSTFPVAASSDSGLSVAITTSGSCSISGNTVTMTSGAGSCIVHYNQSGDVNYNAAAEVTDTTTASPANTTMTVLCPASVTYNGSAQTPCSATVTGPGGFSLGVAPAYSNNINAGIATANASYVGNTNYNPSSGSKTFTINKVTPTITWSNPVAITYGTPLSATQLNASASVAGSFTYTPSAGTVLNAGANQTLSVHFVPMDSLNFNTPADKTVLISVNKVNPPFVATIKPASTVSLGTVVHEEIQFSLVGSGVLPTGTVSFTLFKNGGCNGVQLRSDPNMPINAAGLSSSGNFTTAQKATNCYRATYSGDGNYNGLTLSPDLLLTVN